MQGKEGELSSARQSCWVEKIENKVEEATASGPFAGWSTERRALWWKQAS